MAKIEKYKTHKNFFGHYTDPVYGFKGKKFEVNGWIVSEFVMKELVPIVGFHPYPLPELFLLTAVCCWYKPKQIFEWGTNIGKSARIFHEINTKFDIGTKVYTIDLTKSSKHPEFPNDDQVGFFIKNIPDIFSLKGDGLTESLRMIKKSKIDGSKVLFFLDGDHSFETVSRELVTIFSQFRDTCVIVHDSLDQTKSANYNLGPRLAIKKLIKKDKKRKILIESSMSLPGMTVII